LSQQDPEYTQAMNDQMLVRRQKLAEMREAGIDPYGARFDRTHTAAQIISQFETLEGSEVRIAGRIMAMRGHGKAGFADIQDLSGQIQLYTRIDEVGEEAYSLYTKLDLGDIIGVKGEAFRTRRGEISVKVEEFVLLSKALRPLPEKWHGLTDTETRYRQRYLDLIVNPAVREIFITRSRIVATIRRVLEAKGFLEVETPMLNTIPGGAVARPFVTYHNALDMNLYLRIAPELYLKRLLVGGMEKVFEIGKNFRNEGISTKHNPEFTSVEVYQAYGDYETMMQLTEELFVTVAETVKGSARIEYQGKVIDLSPPWPRLPMAKALEKYAGIGADELESEKRLRDIAKKRGMDVEPGAGKGKIMAELFEECVEPELIGPIFITDYPVDVSPLAKRSRDPEFTARFEPYINGWEVANGFSELNDPIDQEERFQRQVEQRQAGDKEAHMMDTDYVRALEYGMPPAGGLGIGIDRLVMLMTDSASIREVLLFPHLRSEDATDG